MRIQRVAFAFVALMVTLPLLAACGPAAVTVATSPSPTGASTATANGTPTPTVAPDPVVVFTQPTTCSELAGPELQAEWASRNIVLFNSSNGEGTTTGSPVDTRQQGGNPFGCLWGIEGVDLNTFVLSTQPLSQAAHEGVVSILDGLGYAKTVEGDVVTYTQVGSENGTPEDQLTIHVLRPDSWMTGWASLGGETSRARIAGYLDVVAARLYS